MRKRRSYKGHSGPSYMRGYSQKKRSKFGFSFAMAIILLALIVMAVIAYFSIEPDDGEDVISETTVTSTPRPTATVKPDFTPAPTIDVNETPKPVLEDIVTTPVPKPKATSTPKPKSTPKPTPVPTKAPTPKPTEIPSDPNGTTFINKYVDSGIYIRSDAGKENNVIYHVKREDGQVRLNPTGESKLDSSGYRWYNVITPDGQSGWVREDVVVKK